MVKSISTQPTCYVSIRKSRQKVYSDNGKNIIFIENKSEFQLEFFNPLTKNVMAKIWLNGSLISNNGLVIKPGQRIWLDRFIDTPAKFRFESYEVGNSDEVKEAIRNNGHIRIEFFTESDPIYFNSYISDFRYYTSPSPTTTYPFYSSTGTTNIGSTLTNTSSSYFSNDTRSFDFCGPVFEQEQTKSSKVRSKNSKSIETGRIESGSQSNQQFENVNISFNSYVNNYVEYQLIPVSQKNIVMQSDIRTYCSKCGKKHTQKDNFCSKCGNKL